MRCLCRSATFDGVATAGGPQCAPAQRQLRERGRLAHDYETTRSLLLVAMAVTVTVVQTRRGAPADPGRARFT